MFIPGHLIFCGQWLRFRTDQQPAVPFRESANTGKTPAESVRNQIFNRIGLILFSEKNITFLISMIRRLFVFYLLTAFLSPVSVPAQSAADDSTSYQSAYTHTLAVYYRQLGDQSPIYNGRLYPGYGFSFREGIPYFLSGEFRQESVVYDGMKFDNVPLLYDDLSGVIISRDQGYWIQLINERVSSFTLSGHRFIRVLADSLNNGLSATGYYEVLYQGHSTVFKKTIKRIKEELSPAEGILRSIDQSDRYYIRMGKDYFHVKSKRELLNIFSDHRKQ